MRKIIYTGCLLVSIYIGYQLMDVFKEDTKSTIKEMEEGTEEMMIDIEIEINGYTFDAKMYDTITTKLLIDQFPLAIRMEDLHNNEKFHYLHQTLPIATEHIGQIKSGDIMLYGTDCLVLFYETFSSSYSYTRIGYLVDPTDLKALVGSDIIEVEFHRKD